MNISFVGLGKLGLPVALSIENKGHTVYGYDVNPEVKKYLETREIPYEEVGTPELLENTNIKFVSLTEAVKHGEIVFVPIQTPHDPRFEGITPLPEERADFDYKYLKFGIQQIADATEKLNKDIVLVIISTVLPGTIEREIKPILNKHIKLAYNPFFIAMGTTRADFENPEFVLLGCDDPEATEKVEAFYRTLHDKPVFKTTVRNAELIKVAYNTFISTKIGFINTIMEVCHKTGCNVDAVTDALSLATDRIISTKYLRGGMGDGGGCHPRDNIALSWLAKRLYLSYDWFESIMTHREKQAQWFNQLIEDNSRRDSRVLILGKAFKKGTRLVTGSQSLLMTSYKHHETYDPKVDGYLIDLSNYDVFFIATNHDEFKEYKFPQGSTVIDVWGMIEPQEGVNLVKVGRWGAYR